jgi:hypothetical protein
MQININNPIIYFPSISLEDIEYRENRRKNIIAKMQLEKFKNQINKKSIAIIREDSIKFIN